jgi:hypothetical protein
MSERMGRGLRAAAVGAVVLALLGIVALASGGGRPAVGSSADPAPIFQVRDIVHTLVITFYVLLVIAFVWALRRFGGRDIGPAGPMRLRSLALALAFAGLLWVGMITRGDQIRETIERARGALQVEEEPTLGGEQGQGEEAARRPPPAEFEWEVALAVVGAAAAGVAFLVLRRRRRSDELPPLGEREDVKAELAAAVEETLEDLRRESDPRRAVIAAYAQLERTLTRHRLPRVASEAPFEYLARILRELRVRAPAVLALTELFERARFSLHTIDETMKHEAIEALAAVRDDLRAPA